MLILKLLRRENKMLKNPELRRNLWTELTLKNMVAMFLLLITIYFLAYTVSEDKPFSFLPRISIIFYIIFTYIWGTRKAAETVVKEVNNNTWSFQIMTPTTPTQMAIGKLFGSTALVWFGNIVCMCLYVAAYYIDADRLPDIPLNRLLTNVAIFMLLGLISHMLPLLLSIHSIRWRHFFEQFNVTFFQIVGFITVIPLYFAMSRRYSNLLISWYGYIYTLKTIVIMFSIIFIIWGFISLVNQIKTEMGQEPYPISWLLFTLTLIVILFGFNNYNSSNILVRYLGSMLAFFVTICLTYLTLCGESNLALRPHMVLKYFKTNQYKRLFMIMPRSLVTIPIIIILAIILNVQFSTQGDAVSTSFTFVIWAMIMFMLRDFCFVYLWSIFSQGNDRETTVIPVLITLTTYTIFPSLLYNMDMTILTPIFMPYFYDGTELSFNSSLMLTVIPPTIEFLIMFTLLILGIKKKKNQIELDSEYLA